MADMVRPRDGKPMRRISSGIAAESHLRLEAAAAAKGSVAQITRRAVEQCIADDDDPTNRACPCVVRHGCDRWDTSMSASVL
jgi:hypothetical protein